VSRPECVLAIVIIKTSVCTNDSKENNIKTRMCVPLL
jgi:hypothetical protein